MCRLVVSAILFGLAGCASGPEEANVSRGKVAKAEAVSNRSSDTQSARPVEALRGRVISVNPELRFVVCDFPDQKLPQLNQRLAVYRSDEKVAEIKISGPYRGTTVVADITAGEAKYGDRVRLPR